MRRLLPLLVLTSFLLGGCDMLGIESASVIAGRREADGKAVGAGCRHAARALEDCYALNKRVDKAAIYAGWREMDDYMRENKIDAVAPELNPEHPAAAASASDGTGTGAAADAAGNASHDKAGG